MTATRRVTEPLFISLQWQEKFTDTATQVECVGHNRSAIFEFELQIHVSVGITAANVALGGMSAGIHRLNENVGKLMEIVFMRMPSAEEREVASLQPSRTKNMIVVELRREMGKDVEQLLADNKYFEQKFKFEVVQMQIREIKESIEHESDRVVHILRNSPHERIVATPPSGILWSLHPPRRQRIRTKSAPSALEAGPQPCHQIRNGTEPDFEPSRAVGATPGVRIRRKQGTTPRRLRK
ncbi:hypothetical protein GSI_08115 [Ganoderma sinense ZZ0214-1]|uniref:Uncharacterized protein n=1 Tax=Ganoderma sinense ZZ0214-1 TaxID=1077348 RepID=A0A2G8S7G8_9APHY|nr:hypothetical protein GSI_08115 [Ganoderma sinense ZZ0214-1]